MAFLLRTRLIRRASGTIANKTLIEPPTVFRTSLVGEIYETVAAAMANVPTPPNQSTWWQYDILWEVGFNAVPFIRGVVPDTTILWFDCDLWPTEAARLAAPGTPERRDSFGYQFSPKSVGLAQGAIRTAIEDSLIVAHFAGAPADQRDPKVVTTQDPAHDPLGLCTRPAITAYHLTPTDSPPRFRPRAG